MHMVYTSRSPAPTGADGACKARTMCSACLAATALKFEISAQMPAGADCLCGQIRLPAHSDLPLLGKVFQTVTKPCHSPCRNASAVHARAAPDQPDAAQQQPQQQQRAPGSRHSAPNGPKAPPPAEARARAADATPWETFRVVGVSFDGRQDLLAAVGKGDHHPRSRHDVKMQVLRRSRRLPECKPPERKCLNLLQSPRRRWTAGSCTEAGLPRERRPEQLHNALAAGHAAMLVRQPDHAHAATAQRNPKCTRIPCTL